MKLSLVVMAARSVEFDSRTKHRYRSLGAENRSFPPKYAGSSSMRDAVFNEQAYISRDCLAHHVKRLRQERGWSQLQLADASGLHRSHVSRLENGLYNATINTVDEIANALGVNPGALLEPPTDVDSGNDRRRGVSRDSHLAHSGANQARGAMHFFRSK